MKKYFLYDPEGDGFELFSSEEERDKKAAECIELYLDEHGWEANVDDVCVGVVTSVATQVNVIKRPPEEDLDEDSCDAEGFYWDPDFGYICDYKLRPLEKS